MGPTDGLPRSQLFHPLFSTLFKSGIVFGLGTMLVAPFFCYWLYRTPYVTGVDRTLHQTVPFSHKHHVGGLGIDCRYCHVSVESSAFAGLPTTQTCMTCHSQIWTQAAILAPVRDSFASRTPLHWTQVNRLPDFVFFNHSVHIHAGVACATCHGRVDEMPLMRKARPLTMQWCLACHRDPQQQLGRREDVFTMPPPRRDDTERAALAARYGIPDARRLTTCTVCHR